MFGTIIAILMMLLILIGGILFFNTTANMANGKYHDHRDLEGSNDEFEYGHNVEHDNDHDS